MVPALQAAGGGAQADQAEGGALAQDQEAVSQNQWPAAGFVLCMLPSVSFGVNCPNTVVR